jgi:hypothetical protein
MIEKPSAADQHGLGENNPDLIRQWRKGLIPAIYRVCHAGSVRF